STDVLFSGSEDKTVRIWDHRTSRAVKGIRGFASEITALQPINDHDLVVASDTALLIYDCRALGVVAQASEYATHVNVGSVEAIATRGDFVAFVNDDGHLSVFDCDEETVTKFSGAHDTMASCVAFHPDDPKIASGGFDMHMFVWDMASETVVHRIPPTPGTGETGNSVNPPFVYALQFAPVEGTPIVAGYANGSIMSFEETTGRSVCWLDCHAYSISDLAFVPSNPERLVTVGLDCMLKVWDADELLMPNVVDAEDPMQVVLEGDPPLVAAAGLVSKPDTLAIAQESTDMYIGQDIDIAIYTLVE
ncbi:hypothetical protein FBU59_006571, partial [Linderina macrospora]